MVIRIVTASLTPSRTGDLNMAAAGDPRYSIWGARSAPASADAMPARIAPLPICVAGATTDDRPSKTYTRIQQ